MATVTITIEDRDGETSIVLESDPAFGSRLEDYTPAQSLGVIGYIEIRKVVDEAQEAGVVSSITTEIEREVVRQ